MPALTRPRLIRGSEETRQQRAMREIHDRRSGENVPQGEGEIDNVPTGNYIDTEAVLAKSFRYVTTEAPIPRLRRILKWLRVLVG